MREAIYPELINELDTNIDAVGAVIIASPPAYLTTVEPVDILLLVFTGRDQPSNLTGMYLSQPWRIKTVWVPLTQVFTLMMDDDSQEWVEWILNGEVLYDPEGEVEELTATLKRFPLNVRLKKMCVDLCKLLEGYHRSRWHLEMGEVMDAYSHIQDTLRYWGRLAVMESGEFPQRELWKQVRRLHPGIYKWFHELASGGEPPDQRIRLVLLAVEYAVLSKLDWYGRFVLDILRRDKGMWSLRELNQHLRSVGMPVDSSPLVEELVKRSLVEEISLSQELLAEQRYRLVASVKGIKG